MIAVNSSGLDPRGLRALEIAAEARQWLRCRTRSGRKAFGIPSQRHAGVYHLADAAACTCVDFRRRQQPCKHILAVRLHVARIRAERTREEVVDRP